MKFSHVLKSHQKEKWSALICKCEGLLVVFERRGGNQWLQGWHLALQTFDGALENRAAYQLAIKGLLRY